MELRSGRSGKEVPGCSVQTASPPTGRLDRNELRIAGWAPGSGVDRAAEWPYRRPEVERAKTPARAFRARERIWRAQDQVRIAVSIARVAARGRRRLRRGRANR